MRFQTTVPPTIFSWPGTIWLSPIQTFERFTPWTGFWERWSRHSGSDVNKDLSHKDKDKDWSLKDKDKDKDWSLKDKDKDKDLSHKDKDKDKDSSHKNKDKDKDLSYKHKNVATTTLCITIKTERTERLSWKLPMMSDSGKVLQIWQSCLKISQL